MNIPQMQRIVLFRNRDNLWSEKRTYQKALLAIGLVLAMLFLVMLTAFADKVRFGVRYDSAVAAIQWSVSPDTMKRQLEKGGFHVLRVNYVYDLPYMIRELQGEAAGEYALKDTADSPDPRYFYADDPEAIRISVCFYETERQARLAAGQFSPSGGVFYRPGSPFTREPVYASPDSDRRIWLYQNALVFTTEDDPNAIGKLTAFFGEPIAFGGNADPAQPAFSLGERLRIFFGWRWWPEIFSLVGMAALAAACFWLAGRKPPASRLRIRNNEFAARMGERGLPLLPIDKITADPYDGVLGVPFAAFMRDTAAGRRTAEGLNPTEKESARLYVYFYQTAKKAAAARESLSPQGDKLQLNERILRLPYSPDRMIVRHKNLLIYYNGRERSVRKMLESLAKEG